MNLLKKYIAIFITIFYSFSLSVVGAQTLASESEDFAHDGLEGNLFTGNLLETEISSETEHIDYNEMTVTTAKIYIDEFLAAFSIPSGNTLEVLDETGAAKTRGEVSSGYKLCVTDVNGETLAVYTIIQTVQGVYSLTSDKYQINEKSMTISGIPYSDKRISQFLSNLEITSDMAVEVLRPDMSPLYGDMYTGCLLCARTIHEERVYTLNIDTPTVGANVNLALKKPVEAPGGRTSGYVVANLVDGNRSSRYVINKSGAGEYAVIDLGSSMYFDKMALYTDPNHTDKLLELDLFCSEDGVEWEKIYEFPNYDKKAITEIKDSFGLRRGRYIKLEQITDGLPHLFEFELYSSANYSCALASDRYSVDNEAKTVSEVDTTDIIKILSGISALYGSTAYIVDAEGNAVENGECQEGYKIRCMSESGVIYEDYSISTNLRPRVTGLTVTGSMAIGETLSAFGEYYSPSGLPEDRVEYQWCRSMNVAGPFIPIQNAESDTYTIREEDAGYYICVKATAYSAEEPSEGIPVYSNFCGLVGDYAFNADVKINSASAPEVVDGDASTGRYVQKGDNVLIDLGEQRTFNHLSWLVSGDISKTEYVIDYSEDGTTWKHLTTYFGRNMQATLWFEPLKARYIKMNVAQGNEICLSALSVDQSRLREREEREAYDLTKSMLDEYFKTIESDVSSFNLPYLGMNGAKLLWSSNSSYINVDGEKAVVRKPDTETRATVSVQISTPYHETTETYSMVLEGKEEQPVKQSGNKGGGNTTNFKAPVTLDTDVPDVSKPVASPFHDIETHWGKEEITFVYERGLISADESGKFRPDDAITRAEFAKLSALLMGYSDGGISITFSDVPKDAWSYRYISALYEKGIINGKSEDYFGANEAITRQDAAVILYRAQTVAGKVFEQGENTFLDKAEIADYAKAAVSALAKAGILQGKEGGNFVPDNNITRAEAAAIIARLLRG